MRKCRDNLGNNEKKNKHFKWGKIQNQNCEETETVILEAEISFLISFKICGCSFFFCLLSFSRAV